MDEIVEFSPVTPITISSSADVPATREITPNINLAPPISTEAPKVEGMTIEIESAGEGDTPNLAGDFFPSKSEEEKKPEEENKPIEIVDTLGRVIDVDYEHNYNQFYNRTAFSYVRSKEDPKKILNELRIQNRRAETVVRPNAKCPCGSNKKYKNCCYGK